MQARPKRSEVPIEATWNLSDLYSSQEAWKEELMQIQKDVAEVIRYEGKLGESAATLLACLEARDALIVRMSRANTYAHLQQSGDGTDPVNQANSSIAGDVLSQVNSQLSFISSEILALPDGTVERYLEEEPKLAIYRKGLTDLLETKPHRLSAETEAAFASLGELFGAPYRIYLRSKLSDMSFADVEAGDGTKWPVSFALYEGKYEMSPDPALRRAAYASFSETLKAYRHTFAQTYATEVKKQVVLSRLRKYNSVTEMLLQPQEVTLEMYHHILDIIQEQLAPHMRRYAKLKQRELGLDKMMFCDLKAPLDPEYNPHISIEEAGKLIAESLEVLGPEYGQIIQDALNNRWIDYADNVGKSTGAFCSSPYGAHPYILISWADNMRGAFTLAHELGHAGHFALAGRYQPYATYRPAMYFIEAPSTMNEMLLAQHIMKQSSDNRMKRWVIQQLLSTYYHNFVTHLLEGEMQRRVYDLASANEPLTAKTLSEQKGAVLAKFWGDAVELDEGAHLTWMRQPHYYMGLYPYTYSAGLTVSTAAARMIQEEGQPAVDRWLQALKAGGTLKPLDLIKITGVDMSGPAAIEDAVAYVGSLVDELERLS